MNDSNFFIYENNADSTYLVVQCGDTIRIYTMQDEDATYDCFMELWTGKTTPEKAISNWEAEFEFTGKPADEVNKLSRHAVEEFLDDPTNYPCYADKIGIRVAPFEDSEGNFYKHVSHISAQHYLEKLFASGVPYAG